MLGYVTEPTAAYRAYDATFKYALARAAEACKRKQKRERKTVSACVQPMRVVGRDCTLACLAKSELVDRRAYLSDALASLLENFVYHRTGPTLIPLAAIQGAELPPGSELKRVPVLNVYSTEDRRMSVRYTENDEIAIDNIIGRYGEEVLLPSTDVYAVVAKIIELSRIDLAHDWLDCALDAQIKVSLPLDSLRDKPMLELMGQLVAPAKALSLVLTNGHEMIFTNNEPSKPSDVAEKYEKQNFIILPTPESKEAVALTTYVPPWYDDVERELHVVETLDTVAKTYHYRSEYAAVMLIRKGALWFPIMRKREPSYLSVRQPLERIYSDQWW